MKLSLYKLVCLIFFASIGFLNAANVEIVTTKCICVDGEKGGIVAQVVNGTVELDFFWTGPLGYTSTNLSVDDLIVPGNYTLSYTNSAGCTFSLPPVSIDFCDRPLWIDIEAVSICDQDGTGSVLCTPVGLPIENFSVAWANGASTQHLENVSEGNYSVTVSYGNGCETIRSAEVINAHDPLFNIQIEQLQNCLCSAEPTAFFNLNLTGQYAPYTFQWEGPDGFSSAEQNPLIQDGGIYRVTVTDAYGCEKTEETTVELCSGEIDVSVDNTPAWHADNAGLSLSQVFAQ